MAAFETLGGGGKGYCLLYRCVVILMPPESGISHLHSLQDLRKKNERNPQDTKYSFKDEINAIILYCNQTCRHWYVCADENCGKDTVEMIFSNLLKAWTKFPADVGCCNAREVDVLSHRQCSSSVMIVCSTGASTREISLWVLRGWSLASLWLSPEAKKEQPSGFIVFK